eukprot:359163-Pelagomonas_calceolata.AAC.3
MNEAKGDALAERTVIPLHPKSQKESLCGSGGSLAAPQVAVIIAASSLAWMILLPASLGPSDSPSFGSRIHGAKFIIPASLLHDLLLSMLAFGAATAAAPENSGAKDVYSRVAASVAMMFFTAFSLSASLIYLGYSSVMMKHPVEKSEKHAEEGYL